MTAFRYGSVCSGIEAATVAWHPLGWHPVFFSEIEAFPRAVLAERWSGVPVHGDFTTIQAGDYGPIDLLVGGTPCQDFSVAGLRAGLAGERGKLTIEFVRLAQRLCPRWLVWENVPGVLSADDGAAFAFFLKLLAECGYGFAYRVLDAQHFGVPQRRRRVFVVGYLGDWRPPAAVLFERESLRGDSAPRREAGQGIAPTIAARTKGGGGLGTDFDCGGGLIAPPIAVDARNGTLDEDTTIPVQAGGDCKRGYSLNTIPLAFGGNNQSGPIDTATACNAHGGPHGRQDFETETFVTHTLTGDHAGRAQEDGTGHGNNGSRRHYGALAGMTVRRLTPVECEKLQGFPPQYTAITYRGKPAADGPRYRALGNSMAVPCMSWLGERVDLIERLLSESRAA